MEIDLIDLFKYYCSVIENHPQKDEFRLEKKQDLYGLYKQATIGDAPTQRPSFLQAKALAKWNAWDSMRGMTQKDALSGYILTARSLQGYFTG